jgi:predicted dithiol-disulfide oxidoreductase (DUF899 family)
LRKGREATRGTITLADLLDGRSQLIVYHFMLGPGWQEGCPSCSYVADHFDGSLLHLGNRDTTLAVVSRAPLAEIDAFKTRMGWKFQLVSSYGSDFNFDYHVSFTPEERSRGEVYYNYVMDKVLREEAPGFSFLQGCGGQNLFHVWARCGYSNRRV